MKKFKLLASALMLSLCTLMTPSHGQAGPIVLRACTNASPEFAFAKAFDDMADYVQKNSNGRYRIDVYAGGKLGSDAAIFQAIQMGTVHFLQLSSSNAVPFFPDFGVFDMPYLFPSLEAFRSIFDGKLGEEIARKYSNDKFKICLFSEVDFRKFFTSRPIKTFDDMKGLKIRATKSKYHIAALKALGCNATPMAFTEVFTGLQQGVVDGVDIDVVWAMSGRFFEPAKYVLDTDHIFTPQCLISSTPFWNKLNDEDRALFEKACAYWKERANYYYAIQVKEAIEGMKKYGCVFTKLSDTERQRFIDATKESYSILSPEQKQLYDIIQNALNNSSGNK